MRGSSAPATSGAITELMWLMLMPAVSVGVSSSAGARRFTYVFKPIPRICSSLMSTTSAASTRGLERYAKARQHAANPTYEAVIMVRSPR